MTTRYASGRREGITEELVTALTDYEAGPFGEREKTALRYADRMYFDHHKMDDALFAEVRGRFTEDETLEDRKSTRLNSSHTVISYAVFCLKKKKEA